MRIDKKHEYKEDDVMVVFVPSQDSQKSDHYDVYIGEELWASYMYRAVADGVANFIRNEIKDGVAHFVTRITTKG